MTITKALLTELHDLDETVLETLFNVERRQKGRKRSKRSKASRQRTLLRKAQRQFKERSIEVEL